MAVTKEDVLQALGIFKNLLDAEYKDKFVLQSDLPTNDDSASELSGRIDVLESDIETLKDFMTDGGADIDSLKTKADSIQDEEITYNDIAGLFSEN